jgi:hypothetical protein
MAGPVTDYLGSLAAPEALSVRVDALVRAYESLVPEEIQSIFVSEFRDETGDTTFESLWLFSDRLVMEAKLLGEEGDQFDFVPHKHGVRHIVVKKRAFDLVHTSDDSQMSIEIWFTDQRYGILKATRENCTDLLTILRRHLLPNALSDAPTSPS